MKNMWGQTMWYWVYGVFRKDICLYVGATGNPFSREQDHKRRFGKRCEFRALKYCLSESRAALFEDRFIRQFKKLGQAKFNRNRRVV